MQIEEPQSQEVVGTSSSIDHTSVVVVAAAQQALQIESEEVITAQNGFQLNRDVMRCSRPDHDMARLKFLCTDNSCKCATKLACAECILNEHKDHKYVILEKFVENVSDKFQRISKLVVGVEQGSRMDEFQTQIEDEVRAEFDEIKSLVIKSFEEFEKDYLAQIARFFETNKPRMEYREKFQAVQTLANSKFETLDADAITRVVDFYADDRLEKLIEDSDKSHVKTKQAITKKKQKYFETFRSIVKDILLDCKATPTKESSNAIINSLLSPMSSTNPSDDKKKSKKITFSEDNQVIDNQTTNPTATGTASTPANAATATAPANTVPTQVKQSNISELQSFSTRSFASETRRFTSSVYKKLKTENASGSATHPQAISTQ